MLKWAVVVAQLVAWLLQTPEDPGSVLAFSNFQNIFQMYLTEKTKINEKEAGNGPLSNGGSYEWQKNIEGALNVK